MNNNLEQPPYPKDDAIGPCVCGSWPGGECLKCEWVPAKKDMTGEACDCGNGTFIETSVIDDINGILHCSSCGKVTDRYVH